MSEETYTVGGGWGDAISWSDYDKRRVYGFKGRKPQIGGLLECDLIKGDTKERKTGVFRFISIEPCRDPHDMFFANVEDVGYKGEPPFPKK